MSDKTRSLPVRVLLVIAAFALVAVPARSMSGDQGVNVALALAIGAIGLLAYSELTGRPLLPGRRRATAPAAPVVEDQWRSDRWVAEAVERGMRSLEEWRLEQRDA